MSEQWYFSKGSERLGPVSGDELRAMAADARLAPTDLVWKSGMGEWTPADKVKGLFSTRAAPPPLPPSSSLTPPVEAPAPASSPSPAARSTGRPGRSQSRRSRDVDSGLPSWAKGAGVAAAVIVGLVVYYMGRGGSTSRPVRPGGTSLSASNIQGYWLNYEEEPDGTATRIVLAYLPQGEYRVLMETERGGQIVFSEGNQGTWVLRGDKMMLTTNTGTSQVEVVMTDPDSMVQMQGKLFLEFGRVPAEAGELKFSMVERETPPDSGPALGGTRLQEFVGTWLFPKMKTADGRDVGGITMVLKENGSFELTIPVGFIDGQKTGGPSSGKWSVVGDSLVLALSDGGPPLTFGIQKATSDFLLLVEDVEGGIWLMKRTR